MVKSNGLFGEIKIESEDFDDYMRNLESDKTRRARKRKSDALNEIGFVPEVSEEILTLRLRYDNLSEFYLPVEEGLTLPQFTTPVVPNHYVLAHHEIFQSSTGIKPLGPAQIDSTHHSQIIIQHGGRIVKAEPRGFGKTSRSCNEFLLGVLQGYIKYGLIICSTLEKAEEIIISLTTEILENEMLAKLYPREVAAFKHIDANPRRAEQQTYEGEFTHVHLGAGLIRFPVLPNCASSGAILNIRTKKNVRGIYFTDRAGIYAGKRRRPTHLLLDDVQTDEEAENEKQAAKIIRILKKSVLRSGGHSKRLSAIMTCTPIAPNDVSHHFLLREPWQHVIYQMLTSRADKEDLWFGEYATRLRNFNKTVPGSQIKAALNALEYYKENKEEMDKGAVATWEWCYEYEDSPQTEISAIQHAYNIMILEGNDVFESECQCNIIESTRVDDITYCTANQIMEKISHLSRYQLASSDRYVATHIDVGLEYLTYVTVSSGSNFKAHVIDYGTWPEYPHRFAKGKQANTLRKMYPDIPIPEERIVVAIKELLHKLGSMVYTREDGVRLSHNTILVDESKWTEHVRLAVRSSPYRNITHPMRGVGINAKDKTIEERNFSETHTKYHHAILLPTPDRTMFMYMVDVNYFKCRVHIAFSHEPEQAGSLSLFLPEFDQQHVMVAEHSTGEIPSWDVDPKTDKRVVVWEQINENEYFDNLVGGLAGLALNNVTFDIEKGTEQTFYDINDYLKGRI